MTTPSPDRQTTAWLRLESLAILVAATVAYFSAGSGWKLFLILFLVPDLSMLGYLAGRTIGAYAYNAAHSYLGPAIMGAVSAALEPALLPYAFIWIAHIGFDRTLGYGLKQTSGFQDTHLGRIGRARSETQP